MVSPDMLLAEAAAFVRKLRSPSVPRDDSIPEGYDGTLDRYSDFTAVNRPEDLFQPGDRIHRRASEHPGPTPPSRILAGWTSRPIWEQRSPPDELRLVKIDRALVLPRQMIFNLRTGLPIFDSLRKVGLKEPVLPPKDFKPKATIEAILSSKKIGRIRGGFTLYASSRHKAYGHSLLEGMSRLWALPEIGPRIRTYLVPRSPTDFAPPLYAPLGLHEGNIVRLTAQPLIVENLVMPSQAYTISSLLSPAFWDVADRIRRHYARPDRPRLRIYVSRRMAHKRRPTNEAAIEAEFAAYGFTAITPETMSIPDQIETFAAASWVAGPVGSGMYNAIFSPPHVRKIVLGPGNFHTRVDGVVAREHGPLYIFGRPSGQDTRHQVFADWDLDPGRVRYALERIFAPRWRHTLHNLASFTSSAKLGGAD